jgi:hypothetical protein
MLFIAQSSLRIVTSCIGNILDLLLPLGIFEETQERQVMMRQGKEKRKRKRKGNGRIPQRGSI